MRSFVIVSFALGLAAPLLADAQPGNPQTMDATFVSVVRFRPWLPTLGFA
jgi:hypothetical protein